MSRVSEPGTPACWCVQSFNKHMAHSAIRDSPSILLYAKELANYGKSSRTMQFLLATGFGMAGEELLSTPFLNKLNIGELGRKNAYMGRFGQMTRANWQGAPSRDSVQVF